MTGTTYGSLTLGQMFLTDDGEFSLVKLRDGARVMQTGIFVTMKDDEIVDPFGDAPVLHDKPTEIERAAITLLVNANTIHPGLQAWIQAMATNPDEFRHLDEYVLDPTSTIETGDGVMQIADFCRQRGLVVPKKQYDRDNSMISAIQDLEPAGEPLKDKTEKRVAHHDRVSLYLAMAIREYRYMGRPDGDQTHPIRGMGSVLMNVTTSLAAAVVEFHKRTVNLLYLELEDR